MKQQTPAKLNGRLLFIVLVTSLLTIITPGSASAQETILESPLFDAPLVVPQQIVPQQIVPQQIVPQQIVPLQIVPQEIVPQQIVPQADQPTAPTLPVFIDGEAQIVEGFRSPRKWIWHDLWVETEFDSDGTGTPDRMHVSVCRPQQTDTEGLKVPVVYNSSPYFSGTSSTDSQYFWDPKQEVGETPPERTNPPAIERKTNRPFISRSYTSEWVPRGFAVVHSESPGTGLSQGCPTIGGENESLAPKAVIDWLCGRAKGYTSVDGDEEVIAFWSTGKIGMIGTSYNGTIPIAAATTGVEGLEAIIPVAPNTSYYHYYRSNGLVRHPGGYMGEDVDVLYNFIHSGDPERSEYCDCEVRDKEMLEGFDRVHGDYNDFWAGRDYLNKVDTIKAAVLMSHGFNDWNVMPIHSFRIYDALNKAGRPCQIFYHQGGHGGDPPLKMKNRWFSHYLYGIDNGVEQDPKAQIVREGKPASEPTPYDDYPNPAAVSVTFYPQGNGIDIGELATDQQQQENQTLIDDVALSGTALATSPTSKHRLLFATPVLKQPVHISGLAKLKIKLASSKPAANLSVWLVSLPWTAGGHINDNIISRGWADPQNSQSLTESKPLVPGEFVELSFDLQPDDQIIPAGQQIGLMIFSSDRDFTLWPQPGTELTIDLNSTTLELPIVGGSASVDAATLQPDVPQPR